MSTIIRLAEQQDAAEILALATAFATSFEIDPDAFHEGFAAVLGAPDACLLVAAQGAHAIGYLLGFVHQTFYANGRVAWVEEIMVGESFRRNGIGEQLMQQFEVWATAGGAKLVALATRRAAAFYRAVGYEESATYFRKRL